MKVLQINSFFTAGGPPRIVNGLYDELVKNGSECKIAAAREKIYAQKDSVKIGSGFGVYVNALKARIFDNDGFSAKRATKKFLKWADEYNPDVIHLHNIHGYYINIELLFDYLKRSGKNVIWTLHDCWACTGHSAYCDAVHCERWQSGCYDCPQKKEYPKSYTDCSERNWQRKKAAFTGVPNLTIVTPSHWLADIVKASFLKEYPVEVIHNGIDTEKFYPMKNDFRQQYGIDKKFILLGVSSVWNDLKGYKDFIKLAEKIDERFVIIMVGLNKEQIKKLPENIIGIERTASIKELSYIYSSADMFLNLTYCDNYPTVNIEAIACGTPVLTYNTGGSPESVMESGGYIVPQGDIEAVYHRVLQCMQDSLRNQFLSDKPDVSNKAMMRSYISEYTKNSSGGGYFSIKERLGLIGKYVVLGVASVWDRRKGLPDLIELSKRLDENYQLVIVGLSKKQLKNLPKNIIGIQKTNSIEELRKLYAISDIFVNPTYEDNYPTVNLEAQACGTPVITYNTGGCAETLSNPESTVVKTGDINALYLEILDRCKTQNPS